LPEISHYEILEKLGEGGMGVVWKARDTRLERFVALKLLPASKTADPARRQRFMQEARAASALNHPRIITIYEIDRENDADFIAMEFVPGRTLDQLITGRGLRIGEALKYAIQIADALAAAHAAGIIHRDLKPPNVMVTEKGDVKVLDFGLAKLMEDATGITEDEHTRTIVAAQARTEEGTILGTAAYMSPEQAEGKKVDARSDIFSFGSLLYEMLTGRRAFQGDSKMSTLAAILNREPEPLEKLNPGLPRELVRIVQRCLRKDPDRRAHSMQDLKLALEEIREDSDSGLATMHSGAHAPVAKRRSRALLVTAIVLIPSLAITGFWISRGLAKPELALKAVPLTSYPGYESSPTFSPDGGQLAYSWNGDKGDNYDIYVQLVGSGRPLRLTTDPAMDVSPSWSPDGRSIAFGRIDAAGNATLMLIPALGGAEREIAQLGTGDLNSRLEIIGGWSPDGRWLVASTRGPAKGLYLVSVETGEKRRLTSTPAGMAGDFFGSISPDGRTLGFVRAKSATGGSGVYASDLFAMPLTADLRPAGDARPLTSDNAGVRGMQWAAAGSEIVYSSNRGGTFGLWRVAFSGTDKPRPETVGGSAHSFAISARASRLVYEQGINIDINIWRLDLSQPASPPVIFISSSRQEMNQSYSLDGKRIAFRSDRSGAFEIWTCDSDGSNAAQLTNRPTSGSPMWSPDNASIAFDSQVDGAWQIFTIPAHGGQSRQVTTSGGSRPSWSHDGKWLYFDAKSNVWKIPAGGGTPIQVTKNGAANPVESEDGRALYYSSGMKILRSATDGSGETALVPDAAGDLTFAVAHDGIYYLGPSQEVRFFSFTTHTSRTILTLQKRRNSGLAVSPDGHWLLFAQTDNEPGSDLMLVDNFR
jgi:serine/threonine protein kinase